MAGNLFPMPFIDEDCDAMGDEVIVMEEHDSTPPIPPEESAFVPRRLSLVRLTSTCREWFRRSSRTENPLLREDAFVFLGEIPNMPAHCVVLGSKSGQLLSGFHTENFEEIPQEEA